MNRAASLCATLLGACAASPGPKPPPPRSNIFVPPERPLRLAGIEVFGTRSVAAGPLLSLIPLEEGTAVSLDRVLPALAPEERAAFDSLPPDQRIALFALALLGKGIERRALEVEGVRHAAFSAIDCGDGTVVATLDVAEEGDPGLLGLREEPDGEVSLPPGLVPLWNDYRRAILTAFTSGRPIAEAMEAGHWRTADSTTRAIEDRFLEIVREHFGTIRRAALLHRDGPTRQMCAYLLSWAPDPEAAVETLLEAVRDSESSVRNEAARALIPLARHATETRSFAVPLDPVLELLHRPAVTDRNKAAAVLLELAKEPANRAPILARAEERLERMAESKQPNNRDPARRLLELLRGAGTAAP